MTRIKLIASIVTIIILVSCDKMEDNYQKYLDLDRVYSAKIYHLTADVGLKTALLKWENPPGDIAKKIYVDFQDDSIRFDSMVDSVFLENLEIKGYTVSIYTIDKFNNYSVPTSIQIFPNGEK